MHKDLALFLCGVVIEKFPVALLSFREHGIKKKAEAKTLTA